MYTWVPIASAVSTGIKISAMVKHNTNGSNAGIALHSSRMVILCICRYLFYNHSEICGIEILFCWSSAAEKRRIIIPEAGEGMFL